MNNLEGLIEKLITFVMLPVVAISFVLNSLSSDPQIYQGIARLTDYFGTFPQNVDAIWEIKPIANRMMNYLLYKFATIFVPFSEHYVYGEVVKIITLVIVLLICYYFSRQIKIKYSFQLSSILILSTSNVATLQAEWWAVVFTLLAISLMLDKDWRLHYVSGIVISIVFFFKGISGIFMVTSLFAVYLLIEDIPRLINITKRMLVGFGITTLIVLFSPIFPHALNDIILSSQIVPIGRLTFDQLIANLTVKSYVAFIDLPFLLVGFLSAFYMYIVYMGRKEFKNAGIFILMWLSTISMVLIQGEFFTYHYCVLLIPAIITILLCKSYISHAPISAIFITFMFFLAFVSFWTPSMGVMEHVYWEKKVSDANNITTQFPDLMNQSNMLYLEACNAPYYFQVNATSRYICSLPVQRNAVWWNLTGLPAYQVDYNGIMNYKGKYVIYEDSNWFTAYNDTQSIDNKIQTEYRKVYDNGSWRVWERLNTT